MRLSGFYCQRSAQDRLIYPLVTIYANLPEFVSSCLIKYYHQESLHLIQVNLIKIGNNIQFSFQRDCNIHFFKRDKLRKMIILFTKLFVFLVTIFSAGLLSSCAELKEAGRTMGHTTRNVTREIGHGTRDAAREIGHGTRRVVDSIGQETKEVAKPLSDDEQ